jgi:hypothetical protein
MALNFTDIVAKIVDNASIGKVVTDVLPGLALAIPIVMLVSMWTSADLLPAQGRVGLEKTKKGLERTLEDLRKEQAAARTRLGTAIDAIRRGKSCPTTMEAIATASSADKPLAAATNGTPAPAPVDSALALTTTMAIDQLVDRIRGAEGSLLDEKPVSGHLSCLLPFVVEFDARRQATERQEKRLTEIGQQLSDASDISKNMQVFSNNLSAVLAVSVILGVIMSQLNRLVFVEFLFRWILPWALGKWFKPSPSGALAVAGVSQQERDALVSDYYRYAEGAMNMVWPLLLLGLVLPSYLDCAFPSWRCASACVAVPCVSEPTEPPASVSPILATLPAEPPGPVPPKRESETSHHRASAEWVQPILLMLALALLVSAALTYRRFTEAQYELIRTARPAGGTPFDWIDPKPTAVGRALSFGSDFLAETRNALGGDDPSHR